MKIASQDRILVALDFDNGDDAVKLVSALRGTVGGFKVGLQLVNSAGFDIFDRLKDAGADRIFYDAKFHDIPNTVAGAVHAAAKRGIWMVNVHACGGAAMLRAAADAAKSVEQPPLLIAVTVLTSLDQAALNNELRVPGAVADHVTHLARLTQASGLDGVVASPHELTAIRAACGSEFVTVIPGVRLAGGSTHDQARFATPGAIVADGAHYMVVGRAITAAPDPIAAVAEIVADIESADAGS